MESSARAVCVQLCRTKLWRLAFQYILFSLVLLLYARNHLHVVTENSPQLTPRHSIEKYTKVTIITGQYSPAGESSRCRTNTGLARVPRQRATRRHGLWRHLEHLGDFARRIYGTCLYLNGDESKQSKARYVGTNNWTHICAGPLCNVLIINLRILALEGGGGHEATFQHAPNTTTDGRWSLQPPHDNDTRPVRSPSTVAVPCGIRDGTPVSVPRLVTSW